jgi:guanosine-3',5'-bis(diphosphate) 3'-pyrophosphohydrolase
MFNKIYAIFIVCIFLIKATSFADVQSTREILSAYSSNNSKVLYVYDQMARAWENYEASRKGQWDLEKLLIAVEFAAAKHAEQENIANEKTPHVILPLDVSWTLWNIGSIRNVDVLTSALLQDTLKNTDATEIEIEALFGERVLNTIIELMEPLQTPTLLEGQLVKLASLLSKMNLDFSSFSKEEKEEYYTYAEALLLALKGTCPNIENHLEEQLRDHKMNLLGIHAVNYYDLDWDWAFFGDNTITRAKIVCLDNDTRWYIDWKLHQKMNLQLWAGTMVKIIRENNEYSMIIPSEGSSDKTIKFKRISGDYFVNKGIGKKRP